MSVGTEGSGPNPRTYSRAEYAALEVENARLQSAFDDLAERYGKLQTGEDSLLARVVTERDAALAQLAAIQGGTGEVVEVVAWLSEVRSGNKTVIRASMSETSLEGMRRGYRDENAVIVRDEPCMTVAQHRRILAQHRQQAGKLVEALKAADDYLSDNPFNEIGSRSILHRQMKDAIAAWEKTK